MRGPIGSTSWPNRHRACFSRLNELLRGSNAPLVAVVGPGAVTRLCRPFLHDAARPASWFRLRIGDAARYGDQVLRRIPFLSLVSLEPLEVEAALTVPHQLAVIDISPRVLAAVQRDLPAAQVHCADLAAGPLPLTADVIIAFNVVSRIAGAGDGAESSGEVDRAQRAMANLAAALHPGGVLLADDRSTDRFLSKAEFERVAEKTHRRKAANMALAPT